MRARFNAHNTGKEHTRQVGGGSHNPGGRGLGARRSLLLARSKFLHAAMHTFLFFSSIFDGLTDILLSPNGQAPPSSESLGLTQIDIIRSFIGYCKEVWVTLCSQPQVPV